MGKKDEKKQTSKKEKRSTIGIDILDLDTIKSLEKFNELGNSPHSKVYEVYTKELRVLKEMAGDISYSTMKKYMIEYEIMNSLDHPNILKTYGIFLGDKITPPSILLEHCESDIQQLFEKSGKSLTKIETAFIIYQIAEGMKFIHLNNIIHRDLKPKNILISKYGTIKICDFGISKLKSSDEYLDFTGNSGTLFFMAPELLNEEKYNEKVDVYSFGIVAFYILNEGKMPKIKLGDLGKDKKPEIPPTFTSNAKEMIELCLNFKPEQRPSFNEILEQMKACKYQMTDMNETEISEIDSIVKMHQQRIPTS